MHGPSKQRGTHYVVNVRHGVPQLLRNTDQQAWERKCRDARQAMQVPFIVAPDMQLSTVRGRLLGGAEVRREDVLGADGMPSSHRWYDLLLTGHVLAKDG